ncbi:MAG: antibiotic biosynthesis monooxygenase [Deltaproteobacteria bacterium]|nr:antibiotic biosynthesis monooxygenase [Deltaproteobacteria bacterium]
MAIKTIIRRKATKVLEDRQLMSLMIELRTKALAQPGFISGETLRRVDRPGDLIVIGTWKSQDAWNAWKTSPERAEIQTRIDSLLGAPTEYEVYEYL